MKVKVISLPYILQVLYVLCFTRPRYQVSVYRTIGPLVCICENKDADQLRGNREADQRLCFRHIDSTIPLLPKSEISSLWPSCVAVQPGLCRTWSKIPKTGFLTTRLICPLCSCEKNEQNTPSHVAFRTILIRFLNRKKDCQRWITYSMERMLDSRKGQFSACKTKRTSS